VKACSDSIKQPFLFCWQVDIGNCVKSNEWDIIEHPAIKNTRYKSCCREPHPYLTFHIKICHFPSHRDPDPEM